MGLKMGYGEFIWKEGASYKGEFKNSDLDGKGVYVWSDGKTYDGEWKNNKMHGFGIFLWPVII